MIKTVTVETAKQLKAAGFPQNTFMMFGYWHGEEYSLQPKMSLYRHNGPDNTDQFSISAPTTDELMEHIPSGMYRQVQLAFNLWHFGSPRIYAVQYEPVHWKITGDPTRRQPFEAIVNESLPEALAELWLWLKVEGLLK